MGIPAEGDSRGITVVVLCTVFVPLSAIAVALRLLSRRLKKKALETNDYMILAALVCYQHRFLLNRSALRLILL